MTSKLGALKIRISLLCDMSAKMICDSPHSRQTTMTPLRDGLWTALSSDPNVVHLCSEDMDLVVCHGFNLGERVIEGFSEGFVLHFRMVDWLQILLLELLGSKPKEPM